MMKNYEKNISQHHQARRVVSEQERDLLLSSSSSGSDGASVEFSSPLHHQHGIGVSEDTASNNNKASWNVFTTDDEVLSPWITTSTTPMTTRPHFPSHRCDTKYSADNVVLSPMRHRRIRSRSLGSSLDHHYCRAGRGEYVDESDDALFPSSRLVIPSLRSVKQQQQLQSQLGRIPHISISLESGTSTTTTTTTTLPVTTATTDTTTSAQMRISDSIKNKKEDEEEYPLLTKATTASATTPSDKNDKNNNHHQKNPFWICLLYGFINATIVLPVLMSFCSIIYRDEFFGPYMPILTKLTVVSGLVHQICFSTFSSLPFAVGQVQDAGLIFLSGMASQLVRDLKTNTNTIVYDDDTILATVTVALSLATALLGVGLVLMGGWWQIAKYVQLLPTCVIGGYLAFIGYFCGASGVALMMSSSSPSSSSNSAAGEGASDSSSSLSSLSSSFSSSWTTETTTMVPIHMIMAVWMHKLLFVLPGLLGGIGIYWAVRLFRHMAVLPTCILLLLFVFYVALYFTDTSIAQATEYGWIRTMDAAPPVWYSTWDYLRFDLVVWSALPQLLLTELSMIFVVALSSSLDVAAIELELQQPLNYNYELATVGISNIVSGLTGGYTGSYIFSQSIFSLRAGIRSRLAGFILALTQLVVVLLPFNILAYVPNFFFGSLLTLICVDLLFEWLWDVRHRLTSAEYGICLGTFFLIQVVGVEYGILAGVALYAVCRKVGINVGELKMGNSNNNSEENLLAVVAEEEEDGDVSMRKGKTVANATLYGSTNGS